MQITLKQSEIEVALKNYIQGMGINLVGKTIEVAFTAGRKEAGISAELDINEIEISAAPNPVQKVILPAPVVESPAVLGSIQEFRPTFVSREVAELEPENAVEPAKEEAADETVAPANKVSLFG